jgi:hypothetical protein
MYCIHCVLYYRAFGIRIVVGVLIFRTCSLYCTLENTVQSFLIMDPGGWFWMSNRQVGIRKPFGTWLYKRTNHSTGSPMIGKYCTVFCTYMKRQLLNTELIITYKVYYWGSWLLVSKNIACCDSSPENSPYHIQYYLEQWPPNIVAIGKMVIANKTNPLISMGQKPSMHGLYRSRIHGQFHWGFWA